MYNQYYYKNKILQQQLLQKPKYVIMAAIAALFLAGVVTSGGHVRAEDGWGAYDSNGNWHCVWQWDSNGHKVCEAYIQQPRIPQVNGLVMMTLIALTTHVTEYTHSLQNNSHMSKRSHFFPSMMDATDTGLSASRQSVSITEVSVFCMPIREVLAWREWCIW
jgi:hypothetical protein